MITVSDTGETVRVPRSPQEAAEQLARSLDKNTAALGRIQRRYRLVVALIATVALTLGVAIKFNYDGNVARCESGNELREDIDAKWDAITDFLEERGSGEGPDGERFLMLLSQDLEKRDCSAINWLGR